MKRYLIGAAALLLAVALTACGGTEEGGDTSAPDTTTGDNAITTTTGSIIPGVEFDGSLDGYTVIVPFRGETALKAEGLYLQTALEDVLGVEIRYDTDLVIEGVKEKADKEILVGNTSREETIALEGTLGERDYVISMTSSRIVILGGSDAATGAAVDYFLKTYVDVENKTVTFAGGDTYLYTFSFPTVFVGDKDIGGYSIVATDSCAAEAAAIGALIADKTGKTLPIVSDTEAATGNYIHLDVDYDAHNGNGYAYYVENGNLIIGAPTAYGFSLAWQDFLEKTAIEDMWSEDFVIPADLTGGKTYTTPLADVTSPEKVYILGDTARDALSYKVNEEVEFRVTLNADDLLVGSHEFSYTLYRDGMTAKSGKASAVGGELVVKTTLDHPGQIQLTVNCKDENGRAVAEQVIIGAVVAFDDIHGLTEIPSDFEAFWQARIEELYAIDPTDTTRPTAAEIAAGVSPENYFHLRELTEADIDYYNQISGSSYSKDNLARGKVYEFHLKSAGPNPAVGYITVPNGNYEEKLPIRISTEGAGVRRTSIPGVSTSAILIQMNTHGESTLDLTAAEFTAMQSRLGQYARTVAEYKNPETAYFTYVLLRNVQALRYAITLPEWNGTTVIPRGSSQGGFQSIAIAALSALTDDIPVTRVDADVPWMCDLSARDSGKRKSCSIGLYCDGMDYFDTVNFGTLIKEDCVVNLLAGSADDVCPPTGIVALYNALSCQKTLIFRQNRDHTVNPYIDLSWTVSNKTE